MIIGFSVYALISTSIMISVVTKTFMNNEDIFEMWASLLGDQIKILIFLNFIGVAFFGFFLLIKNIILGKIQESESLEIKSNIKDIVFRFIILLITISKDITIQQIKIFLITLFCRYLGFVFKIRIGRFFLVNEAFNKYYHAIILAFQTAWYFVCLNYTVSSYYEFFHNWNDITFMAAELFLDGVIDVLHYLVKHVLFLIGEDDSGMSNGPINLIQLNDFVFETLNLVNIFISNLYYTLFTNHYMGRTLSLIEGFKRLRDHIKNIINWKKLMNSIKEDLQNPTQEDLDSDDNCIICRNKMTIDDSKKLPCNHCIHTHCLSRWIGQKSTCPLCQYDLSQVIKGLSTTGNPENNANNVNLPVFGNFVQRLQNFANPQPNNDQQEHEEEENEIEEHYQDNNENNDLDQQNPIDVQNQELMNNIFSALLQGNAQEIPQLVEPIEPTIIETNEFDFQDLTRGKSENNEEGLIIAGSHSEITDNFQANNEHNNQANNDISLTSVPYPIQQQVPDEPVLIDNHSPPPPPIVCPNPKITNTESQKILINMQNHINNLETELNLIKEQLNQLLLSSE